LIDLGGVSVPRRLLRRPAHRTWVEVRVVTSPGGAEAVGAMLWELGITGVVEDRPTPSAVTLRCFLPPSRVRPITLRRLRERVRGLGEVGLDPGPGSVTVRPIAARGWVRAWRAALRPIRIGRLMIQPTWLRAPKHPGRILIRIDPGMAFGTGAHASTRLCLRALLKYLPRQRPKTPLSVIDVGTGSGILAIAAARLGAARVWARDVDPVAVAVARENVRVNAVDRVVRVTRGGGLGRAPFAPQVVVANIVAETIVLLLEEVRGRLAPGGIFIGSGIIADRLPDVLAAVAGLEPLEVLADGEWRGVVFTAGPTPGDPPAGSSPKT